MLRIGTRPLAVSAARGSPFHDRPRPRTAPLAVRRRGATGSHVPYRSPDQARATSMPDTAWPTSRPPPGSSRGSGSAPVSMSSSRFDTSSVVHSRSPSWSTPDALYGAPSPQRSAPRLLTDAPCGGLRPPPARAAAEDHQPLRPAPPSPIQHRITRSDLLHRTSLSVRGHTAGLRLSHSRAVRGRGESASARR